MVELYTDRYITDTNSGSSVGERSQEIFTCIGYWGDSWIVKYGDGVCFIKRDSAPILSQKQIEWYYENACFMDEKFSYIWCATDVKGPQGNGTFGSLDEGEWVQVLYEENEWYVIAFEYKGIQSVGWVLKEDTLDVEEYKKMRIEELLEE